MSPAPLKIREESTTDRAAIDKLLQSAFGGDEEVRLVRSLRGENAVRTCLVGCLDTEVVGCIFFTGAHVDPEAGGDRLRIAALGPMAVMPGHQRAGIGSSLVAAGLDACRAAGEVGVIVLGHVDYYPRFGFSPAASYGLRCEFDVPPEVFMALPLAPGVFEGTSGLARYHPAFHGA